MLRSPGPLETLRQRDFRYLLLTTGLERLGFRIREMAQAWLVLQLTDSRLWVGLVNGLPVLPVLALSLWGGVLADRGDRRRLLIRTRFVLAGLAFILAFLISSGAVQLWHILALAIAAALFNSFGITATQTLIYDIVGRTRLMSANILFGATYNLVTFAGPSAGGVMMGLLGLDVVFYCIAAVYVAAIGVLLLIPPRPQSSAREGSSVARDLLEGLAYMRRTPEVLWLVSLGLFLVFAGVYFPLIPVYARDILHVGEAGYGFLFGAQGAGGLLGALSMVLMGEVRRKALALVLSAAIWSAGMVVFAFSRDFALSMACVFVMGFVPPWYGTIYRTLLQTAADEEMRGRVMSTWAISNQMITLGWLLGGVMATVFGNEAALVISGVIFAGFNALAFLSSRPLRQMV